MIARISSQELSGWWMLFQVKAEEAKHQQDLAESGDGQVIVSGLDEEDDGDDDAGFE